MKTERKIYIRPGSSFPYQTTHISLAQTMEQIKALLRKFNCEEILSYEAGATQKIAFKNQGIPYIIDFPEIYEAGKNTPDRLRMDISARIVLNQIKTLLVDVEIGALSFMQAMLRMVALPAPQGVTTLGEVVELQRDNIIRGQIEFDPTKAKALTEAKQ